METTTIQTKRGEMTLHVCKDGPDTNQDWVEIYNEAFPPDQRQPLVEVQSDLATGVMELDVTHDETGRVLCMTLSEIFRPREKHVSFVLACYTAVWPDMRGLGIGSVHRRKLEQLLREEYGEFLGMFTEIESTFQQTNDEALRETRIKRKRFFLKLGLIPLDVPYLFPNYDGGEPLEGELLWFPFGHDKLAPEVLERVVLRIYTEGYKLDENDPFVLTQVKAVSQALAARN